VYLNPFHISHRASQKYAILCLYGSRSMLTKSNLQAPDCNQGSVTLFVRIHKYFFTIMAFKKIISGIKTSLNIPSSSTSVAASDSSALDGDNGSQSSQYSRRRERPLQLDERYTNMAAWSTVRPIDDFQQDDVPQCVRDRTNVDAWKSLF
jgi:hypothetical protein